MRNKSDVLKIVPQFFAYVEIQYKNTIKVFRSDNAPELSFARFFYKRESSINSLALEDQRKIVARKHQHILNVARALFFQSRVPLQFWSECILTFVFLINQTSLPMLDWKTAYELLHGQPADYSSQKTFGCLCFASTLQNGRSKFDPRATPAVSTGYPNGMKAYKVFDIAK